MHVLLDTNIYDRDITLNSSAFIALATYLRNTNSRLLIPSVVEQEVQKHILRDAQIDYSRIKSTNAHKLGLIGDDLTLEAIVASLQRNYTSKMMRFPVSQISYENVQLDTVMLSLVGYLGTDSGSHKDVAVITADQSDFGSSGHLKEELKADIAETNFNHNVYLFSDLGDFLNEHAKPISFIDYAFVMEAIEDYVDDEAGAVDEDDLELDLPNLLYDEDYEVSDITFSDYDIERMYIFDTTEDKYVVYVEVTAQFEVMVSYTRQTEVNHTQSQSYDYKVSYKTEEVEATSTLEYFVYIDKESREVTSVESHFINFDTDSNEGRHQSL